MKYMPINKVIERQGSGTVPYVVRHPDIRGGICEKCGILNNYDEPFNQYRYCEHYRTMGTIACSYCPNDANHNPDEVARRSVLQVYNHPTSPNEVIVVCDEYNCTSKHEKRFKQNA